LHYGGRGSLAVTSGEEQPSLVVADDGAKPGYVACYDGNPVRHRLGTDATERLNKRRVENEIGLRISITWIRHTADESHLAMSEITGFRPIAGSRILVGKAVAKEQPADGSMGTSVDNSHDDGEQVESFARAVSTHVRNRDDVSVSCVVLLGKHPLLCDGVCRIDGIGNPMDRPRAGKPTATGDLFRYLGDRGVSLHRRQVTPQDT